MSIYSTIDYLRNLGMRDGRERGVQAGAGRQLGRLLLRHGKRLFGPPSPEQQEQMDQLMDRSGVAMLEQARDRFLDVPGWAGRDDIPLGTLTITRGRTSVRR